MSDFRWAAGGCLRNRLAETPHLQRAIGLTLLDGPADACTLSCSIRSGARLGKRHPARRLRRAELPPRPDKRRNAADLWACRAAVDSPPIDSMQRCSSKHTAGSGNATSSIGAATGGNCLGGKGSSGAR